MQTRCTTKRSQHLGIGGLVEYDGAIDFSSPLIVEFIVLSLFPPEYPADLFHSDTLS